MLIHSVAPLEYLQPQAVLPAPECRAVDGRFLQGHTGENGFVLDRVISTDPRDYLRADWSPGSVLPPVQR